MALADYAPLIGIVGLLVGAGATYLFGIRSESRKAQMALQRDAYVDFIRSCSMLSISQRNDDKICATEGLILLTEAKTRISVYGSTRVVEAAAAFFRNFGTLDSLEASASFVNLVSIMRRESSLDRHSPSSADLSQLLLGLDIGARSPSGVHGRGAAIE